MIERNSRTYDKQSHWHLSVRKGRAIIHKWKKKSIASWRCTDDSSRRSQKNQEPHLNNCRPHSLQLRSEFMFSKKNLFKNGLHARVPRRKLQMTRKNTKTHFTFAKKTSWSSRGNNLWTGDANVELCVKFEPLYIWSKTNPGSNTMNIILTVNMVGVVWWSGDSLLLQVLDNLL